MHESARNKPRLGDRFERSLLLQVLQEPAAAVLGDCAVTFSAVRLLCPKSEDLNPLLNCDKSEDLNPLLNCDSSSYKLQPDRP
jgi:hypothetical protein